MQMSWSSRRPLVHVEIHFLTIELMTYMPPSDVNEIGDGIWNFVAIERPYGSNGPLVAVTYMYII